MEACRCAVTLHCFVPRSSFCLSELLHCDTLTIMSTTLSLALLCFSTMGAIVQRCAVLALPQRMW